MAKKTGARYHAETLHDCGVSHVFFVPAILLSALAEMATLGIRVDKPADLPAAFAKAFAAGKPVVTDVQVMAPTAWTGGVGGGH